MKKYFCILFLLIITLSACTTSNSLGKTNEESEPLLSEIKALFEEADHRIFDISFPIKIEGEDFYRIVVSGKLESNRTYPIDTLESGG